MSLYRKEGSPYWWADVRIDGRRIRISTKQVVKGAARTAETALIQQLSTGDIRKKAPILREYAKSFLAYVEKTRLSENTKKDYRNGWRLMKDQDIAGMRIDRITTADAETIKVPGSNSSLNSALRALRRMLNLAAEKDLIRKVPKIRLAEEVQRDRVVTAAEELLILAKATPLLRDAYLLVADLGIRPDDAARLSWEVVDFVAGEVFISGGKTGRKGDRHIPMSERVRVMLIERARKGGQWVFPSWKHRGEHTTAKTISSQFSIFKREIGLPKDVVLYSARHTFATDLTEATGNLVKTQKALGHTNLSTTARYNHTKGADIAAIINARNSERQQKETIQ